MGIQLKLFMAVDHAAHRLNQAGLLPRRALLWVCNRFDLWLVPPNAVSRRRKQR